MLPAPIRGVKGPPRPAGREGPDPRARQGAEGSKPARSIDRPICGVVCAPVGAQRRTHPRSRHWLALPARGRHPEDLAEIATVRRYPGERIAPGSHRHGILARPRAGWHERRSLRRVRGLRVFCRLREGHVSSSRLCYAHTYRRRTSSAADAAARSVPAGLRTPPQESDTPSRPARPVRMRRRSSTALRPRLCVALSPHPRRQTRPASRSSWLPSLSSQIGRRTMHAPLPYTPIFWRPTNAQIPTTRDLADIRADRAAHRTLSFLRFHKIRAWFGFRRLTEPHAILRIRMYCAHYPSKCAVPSGNCKLPTIRSCFGSNAPKP